MAKFKQLYRIIEDIVNAIRWTIPFTQAPGAGNQVVLTLDCTAYLNTCKKFKIGADTWEVVSFKFNEELTIKPIKHSNPIVLTELTLTIPTYYHGTVKMTNAEHLKKVKQERNKVLPAIYLYETLNERVNLDVKLAIERTATPTIFILMSNDFKNMIQIDYDTEIYDPISNIEEKFIEELIKNVNISTFTERYDRKNHDQFGYTDRNGTLKHLFGDTLSALELNIPLNINKCSSKNNNC